MALVLDASMALAWCFEDEQTEESDAVLRALASEDVSVPAVWSFEISNAALKGLRRNRLTSADIVSFLRTLEPLYIRHHEPLESASIEDLISLARTYNLSAYDASYLDLALRLGLPLATLDVRLREAADQAGVPLFSSANTDPSR
jgi:predicted nucleic acid-binding protein